MSTRSESRRGGPAWMLSREAFDRMLAALDPDRGRAARRYEELRARLLKFFRWRGCEPAEELVDETFDRMARRLQEGVEVWAGDPSSYLHGVARRVALERWRRPPREMPAPEAVLEARRSLALVRDPEPEDREDAGRRLDCLEGCLASLPGDARRRLEAYHEGRGARRIERRRALAEKLGLSLNALRIQMFRRRAALVSCIERCLERGRRNESEPEA